MAEITAKERTEEPASVLDSLLADTDGDDVFAQLGESSSPTQEGKGEGEGRKGPDTTREAPTQPQDVRLPISPAKSTSARSEEPPALDPIAQPEQEADNLEETRQELYGGDTQPHSPSESAEMLEDPIESPALEPEVGPTEQPVQNDEATAQAPAEETAGQGNWDDLLAEFGAEDAGAEHEVEGAYGAGAPANLNEESSENIFDSLAQPQQPPERHGEVGLADAFDALGTSGEDGRAEVPPNPLALLDDTAQDSVFDQLLQADDQATPADSPVPDLSVEQSFSQDINGGQEHAGDVSMQSMFSNASDWLADTTVDQSFDLGQADADEQAGENQAKGGGEIPPEVPQGWYDEADNFNWYTEEEREQVRQAMVALGQLVEAADGTAQDTPGLGYGQLGQSENAARRTPQPEQVERMPDTAAYDLYTPASSNVPTSEYSYASSSLSPYDSQSSSYAPTSSTPSQVSPYAPAPSSYDPYAPSSSSQPTPYPSLLSNAPPKAASAPRPAPPQRVASNAYDPPFLRPQKSFVRPPSGMSIPPVPPLPQQSMSPPPPPAAAAPPMGPLRRAKTPAGPAYNEPPPRSETPRQEHPSAAPPAAHASQYAPSLDPYAPSETSYAPSGTPLAPPAHPAQQSLPPPKPLHRNQSYNAFDPPMRPTSAARPRATAPPARTQTPPILAFSPPTQNPLLPAAPPSGPPRGPSQGSLRKSPMFDTRPAFESRATTGTLGARGGFSPAAPAERLPDSPHRATPAVDERPEQRRTESEFVISPPRGSGRPPIPEAWTSPPKTREEEDDRSAEPYRHSEPEYDTEQSPEEPGYRPSQTSTDSYAPSGYQPYQPSEGPASRESQDDDPYGLGLRTSGSPTTSSREIPSNAYAPPAPVPERQQSYDPYAPGQSDSYQPQASTSYDPSPYAAQQQPYLAPSDPYSRPGPSSSHAGSDLGISPPQPSYFQAMHAPADDSYVPQQVLDQRPVSEDPLGRCTLAARNRPLAVFGFGGVLITAFPALADEGSNPHTHSRKPSYGYASGRGQLWIRTVSDLAASSALKPNDNVFPGPLVLDPSTPKGVAGEKKKREAVTVYLEARAEEIEKGLPYLKSSASQARREEEGKLVIVKLLSAMIVGEGKLFGSEKADEAVRAALANASLSDTHPGLGGHAKSHASYPSMGSAAIPARASPAHLAELSKMLLGGDKRDAARYAADAGLWSHALVISSSVDPAFWSEMVLRFSSSELDDVPNVATLKATYSVFSGVAATSVDELIKAANLTGDPSQDQWREVIGAVVFNGKPADLACLDELGVRLRQAGLNYPAHACHLLSPTSAFADVTHGAFERSIHLTQNVRDDDAILFAEIAEYARSLVSLPKGQEAPFPGLPQLLPYKLQRAWLAAELGDVDQAKRYCTAVETASKPGKNAPSMLAPPLLASLEDLTERLTGTPSVNPARSFGARKSKAGLGSWIEGRLTKFIAGEDSPPAAKTVAPPTSKEVAAAGGVVGPFSHFSTIAPSAASSISRNSSLADVANGHLGVPSESQRTSPLQYQSHWGADSYDPAGQDQGQAGDGSSTAQWGQGDEAGDDEVEFINPMAHLSLGPRHAGPSDYTPQAHSGGGFEEDEDDDLGMGNSSLSRNRTPRPPADASESSKGTPKPSTPAEEKKADPPAAGAKPEAKGSWLGKWWGKKEGEGSGPVRAKLGDDSSMVFDPELKRWIVKGAKPEAAAPATPPPPPRAQTASPGHAMRPDTGGRAMSATPPPSRAPPSSGPPMGFTPMSEGPKRGKSTLVESVTADSAPATTSTPPTGPPPPGGPPRPPSRAPTGASIDDLLSRPPSKRPASAAKKSMRNRYVDVLQPGEG